LAINTLWGGFDVALGWLWVAFQAWELDVGYWMFGVSIALSKEPLSPAPNRVSAHGL
jgi:hypothetical protein